MSSALVLTSGVGGATGRSRLRFTLPVRPLPPDASGGVSLAGSGCSIGLSETELSDLRENLVE